MDAPTAQPVHLIELETGEVLRTFPDYTMEAIRQLNNATHSIRMGTTFDLLTDEQITQRDISPKFI